MVSDEYPMSLATSLMLRYSTPLPFALVIRWKLNVEKHLQIPLILKPLAVPAQVVVDDLERILPETCADARAFLDHRLRARGDGGAPALQQQRLVELEKRQAALQAQHDELKADVSNNYLRIFIGFYFSRLIAKT